MNRLKRFLLFPMLALSISWSTSGWSQQTTNDRTKVSADTRQEFARQLQRMLLEFGLSPDVFIHQGQLTIFMPISKSLVYQLITKGDLLKQSYDLGYKGLKFMPTHHGQWYIFDFSKGLPQCDVTRKLCV